MKENSTELLNFYLGTGIDNQGRKIEDIWSWDHEKLEYIHDFIQWIFPLTEPSSFNWNAPILTGEEISSFRSSQELKDRLLRSFDLMLGFYGYMRLEDKGNVEIAKSSNYEARIREWATPYNHNFLRITRILKSLTILGLSIYAEKFLEALEKLYSEKQSIIGAISLQYWQAAIRTT